MSCLITVLSAATAAALFLKVDWAQKREERSPLGKMTVQRGGMITLGKSFPSEL